MFTKNDIIYAEPYKYLQHKTRNIRGLNVRTDNFSIDDFDEVSFDIPMQVELEDGVIHWQNRKFAKKINDMSYAGIKTAIVKSRYSPDDQIAILCNKDKSEEDALLYERMQKWRDFASDIANAVINKQFE